MLQLLLFAVLIASVYLAGALLAVPLHAAFEPLFGMPFQDSLSKTILLTGLVFSLLYLRSTGPLDRSSVGWPAPGAALSTRLPAAVLAGLAVMAVVQGTQLLAGLHVVDGDLNLRFVDIAQILVAAVVLGTIVGLVEETLFRGALYSGLARRAGGAAAVIGTGLVYAAAHFVKYPPWPVDAPVQWNTGVVLLGGSFRRFADPAIIDAFLTLLVLGVLLALIRRRTGNIVQCIGFHAGLVAGLEVAGELTRFAPNARYGFLANKYDPELGWVTLFWLLIAATLYVLAGFNAKDTSNDHESLAAQRLP